MASWHRLFVVVISTTHRELSISALEISTTPFESSTTMFKMSANSYVFVNGSQKKESK